MPKPVYGTPIMLKLWHSTLLVCLLGISPGIAQIRNATGAPDDQAAAQVIGYLTGVIEKCPNLEITPEGYAELLKMGKLVAEDLQPGGRMHRYFEERRALAYRQAFDHECAGVLSYHTTLRLKPGHPTPTGRGYTRQVIVPVPATPQ